jgi:hypothetical protein
VNHYVIDNGCRITIHIQYYKGWFYRLNAVKFVSGEICQNIYNRSFLVFFKTQLGSRNKKHRVDCSGRHLTPAGDRGKVETPQTERRGGSTSSPRKASAWSGKERSKVSHYNSFKRYKVHRQPREKRASGSGNQLLLSSLR